MTIEQVLVLVRALLFLSCDAALWSKALGVS